MRSRSLRAHFNERQNEARDENESERTVHCICLGFRYSSKGGGKTLKEKKQNTYPLKTPIERFCALLFRIFIITREHYIFI